MPDEPQDDDELEPVEGEASREGGELVSLDSAAPQDAADSGEGGDEERELGSDAQAEAHLAVQLGSLPPEALKGLGGVGANLVFNLPSLYQGLKLPQHDFGFADLLPKLDLPICDFGFANLIPKLEIPRFDFGEKYLSSFSSLDLTAFLPTMPSLVGNLVDQMSASGILHPYFEHINSLLQPIIGLLGEQALEGLFPNFDDEFSTFPDNWDVDVDDIPDWLEILELVLNEALPLAWVPRASTLQEILRADSRSARRQVYARRWRSVVTDCEAQLATIPDSSAGASYRDFGMMAVRGLRDGHHQLAQSMCVNLFDSALQAQMQERPYKNFINQNRRPSADEFSVRRALVLGGIWASYLHFRPKQTAKIPRALSRHASAHGVSRNQYNRPNAVIALAHVTGLLLLFEAEGWDA